MTTLTIGILREEKEHPDKRVPLPPSICADLIYTYPTIKIVVQPSKIRCYSDQEYINFGIPLKDDLNDCDILMAVKEVPVNKLINNKKYFFFSHTIKKQPHNKALMQALIEKKITLIDYETLTDKNHNRIIGFGRYAGIVGAYNALLGYGRKYNLFTLKPANACKDRAEMDKELGHVKLPNIKIVLTGGGRVANGVIETLSALRIRKVTSEEFLMSTFREPVYCQLNPKDYVERISDHNFDVKDFYTHPEHFKSTFKPYTQKADIYIAAHYWDARSPRMFEIKDLLDTTFNISVIADISCDIDGSVPTTIRSSSIEDPFYGYNIKKNKEDIPFSKDTICIMAVDNLPCELPRDASDGFGKDLLERVIPNLITDNDKVIERATICANGKLKAAFNYLIDYAYS